MRRCVTSKPKGRKNEWPTSPPLCCSTRCVQLPPPSSIHCCHSNGGGDVFKFQEFK
jgi:hypothetical protein